jgi:hypothetical protein
MRLPDTDFVVQRWLGFVEGQQAIVFRTFHLLSASKTKTLCGQRLDRSLYREPPFEPVEAGEREAQLDKVRIPEWEHGLCRTCSRRTT